MSLLFDSITGLTKKMQTYAVEVQIHNSLKSTQFMNIEVLYILKYFRLKSLINVSPANIEPLSE